MERSLYSHVDEWFGGVTMYENPECTLVAYIDAARAQRKEAFLQRAYEGLAQARYVLPAEPDDGRAARRVRVLTAEGAFLIHDSWSLVHDAAVLLGDAWDNLMPAAE